MSSVSTTPTQHTVKHIGIVLANLGKLNTSILKYLVLQINTLQQTFEYEFLPDDQHDEILLQLSIRAPLDKEEVRKEIPSFLDRYREYLQKQVDGYRLKDSELPENLILISLACFEQRYYSIREKGISVLALGEWERGLAPPSLIEFILTLVIREAIGFVCPSLRGSIHLGTRGCICDFAGLLSDARIKALSGFICHDCRAKLEAQGLHTLAEELVPILEKGWLGTPDNPRTPAGVTAKLGYNLFLTKGVKPTFRENMWEFLRQDFFKTIVNMTIAILQAVLIAYLLIRFGIIAH